MPAALIIVDLQNDFCELRSLAVPDSNQIFSIINFLKTLQLFSQIYLTADNHPINHISFASRHHLQPFTTITLQNGQKQELWPDHCVSGTQGQKFSEMLAINENDIVIEKGANAEKDSYSGFQVKENGQNQLRSSLNSFGITQVYVCGLAFDFCVGNTALDSNFHHDSIEISQSLKRYSNAKKIGIGWNKPDFSLNFGLKPIRLQQIRLSLSREGLRVEWCVGLFPGQSTPSLQIAPEIIESAQLQPARLASIKQRIFERALVELRRDLREVDWD